MRTHLAWLALIFGQLSLLAVGGVNATVPEMQRQVVDVRGWMSARDFAALYALAQAAPGPNMLVSTLVGRNVAGIAGAAVATLAMVGPSSVLTWISASAWHRFRARPWRRRMQAGITPVTVGLVAAAAALLAASTAVTWRAGLLTFVVAAAVLGTRVHPLLLLAAGGLLGLAGAL
ncbi:MAG: chromate transporter [Acetobacteraceae bacterium]|nr:chromate transporter [Acetobacteraceae bacterium]